MAKLLKYPMEFANPNSDEMRGIFSRIGLDGDTAYSRLRAQQLRDTLVAQAGLLSMARPLYGSTSHAQNYFHPDYTSAAFQNAPDLHDLSVRKWRPAIISHLESFAAEPDARNIVCNAIVQHFNRIADVVVHLPGAEGPWIPAHKRTTEGNDPLERMGVTAKYVATGREGTYVDTKDHRRLYFSVEKIAEHIGWTIPGIELQDTQNAILDGFTATRNADWAVDPQALFLAGKVLLQGAPEYTHMHSLFLPEHSA